MVRVGRRLCLLTATALFVSACAADGGEPGPPIWAGQPVGSPVMPDLVPEPPDVLQTQRDDAGNWVIRFTSVLVNVGDGDFRLRGDLAADGSWSVEQMIAYSGGGADVVPTEAVIVWAGDGHLHWHVSRVASYYLEELQDPPQTAPGDHGREDSKVGFCFFDFGQELEPAPEDPRYIRDGCGDEDSVTLTMGLTPGWGDTYDFMLPGQSIDVTDLPDGDYRLWAVADEQQWFSEVTRDNNLTWVDFEFATRPDGVRIAQIFAAGPSPEWTNPPDDDATT